LLSAFGLWRGLRAVSGAACLTALVFAGALCAVANRMGPAPELDVEGPAPVILSGCVVEPPALFEEREQFVLELDPGARARVNLYLRPGEAPPPLRYGQRVEIVARVRRPHNFRNPGAFDYVRYLARQDIYWTASVRAGTPVTVLPETCGSLARGVLFAIRTAALERASRLYPGDAYKTAMIEAILLGETARVEKAWTENYRSTGTFHALVISGTHVAALAAFFLFLLRLCFVPEGPALALTVLASWLYALVAGSQAPVVRSAAGLTLFAVARHYHRRGQLLNLLAAAAIGFLALDPEQLFEASFQLSFLAVAFLGAFAIPFIERTSGPLALGLRAINDVSRDPRLAPHAAQFRVETRLLAETLSLWTRVPPRWCALLIAQPLRAVFFVYELIVTSALIQVGLALPMAVYFHRLSITGLSANVIVVPLMGLMVPVGFVAVFTGWEAPARVAAWLLTASQAAVDWHAKLEPAWRIPPPPLWLGAAFAAALLAAALLRRPVLRACAGAAVALLLGVMVWHPFAPKVTRGTLELTAIDVGQGDSLLAAFPDGKAIVVDGGGIANFGRRAPARLNIGEDVVSPYLWSRSIRRLDAVVLTHAHEDHMGGIRALVENFDVRELWTGAMPASPGWSNLRDAALRRGVRIAPLRAGDRFEFGGASLEAFAPPRGYEAGEAGSNNDSLVLRVRFGRHAFLLTGDMEKQVEAGLADPGRIDVLKVAHHGSRTSSTAGFLEAARPSFAIISAGFENSYGHPHRDVLARLAERGAAVLRTDREGLISIRSDGRRLSFETAAGRGAETWALPDWNLGF
jgi:competence protein ComEC